MGRTSLLMVICFNIVFMTMGFNLSQHASDMYAKYTSYYLTEQAQLAAESAANIAIGGIYTTTLATPGKIWASPTTFPITLPLTFANGGASITDIHIDSTKFATKDTMKMIINASYNGINAVDTIDFARVSFSIYAMYDVTENGVYWTTGDTCKGRLHTQDYLYTTGKPYFKGPVTTGKGLQKQSGSTPTFAGGYESPVNQPMPPNIINVQTLGQQTTAPAGKDYTGNTGTFNATPQDIQVDIEFYKNGQVAVTEWTEKKVGSTTTIAFTRTVYPSVSTLAPDGVVLVENMPVHVAGVLNGNVTIGSIDNPSGSGKSSIYIDSSLVYTNASGNITYPNNPDGTPNFNCTSMLGLVAYNNVMITDQYVNPQTSVSTSCNNNSVTLDASIFCLTGGFSAQNYSSRGVDGTIYLCGGIQQNSRGTVASLSGTTVTSGFLKNYNYDNRLLTQSPKGYPGTINWGVMNWYETTATTSNKTFFQNVFGFLNSK